MKHLAFLLVFVLLFSGCTQEEPAYAEPLAPAQEIPQTPQKKLKLMSRLFPKHPQRRISLKKK